MRPAVRALELLLLFGGVPLALRLERLPVPKLLVLAAFTVACFAVLWRDGSFDRRTLGGLARLWAELPGLAVRAAAAALVVAVVVVLRGGVLLELPRTRPLVWLLILCLYPFASA